MLLNNEDCQTTRSTEKVFETNHSRSAALRAYQIQARGACGGYTLARSLGEISFYDVIEAIEGRRQDIVEELYRLSPQL